MNEPFQLVTNCSFKGKDYLVQMSVLNSKKLELIITDKLMGEDWQCEYDASYIEALTHKTGNFKQFDVFVMMLKSGLLKTSDCITLDLLTLVDLEQLRCKKIVNSSSRTNQSVNLNKRYLIITYSVEFDRIHYPLPLDYCGPPDPAILQNNIRKLESEIERLKQKNNHLSRSDVGETKKLKEKIQNLIEDNSFLTSEIHRLNKLLSKKVSPAKSTQILMNSLKKLEEQVLYEKNNNRRLIFKLKTENKQLMQQVEMLRKSEKNIKMKLNDGSKQISSKDCRKISRNNLSPEISSSRKRSVPGDNMEAQLLYPPVLGWSSSSVPKDNEGKPVKKSQNRFLSSSSSESEGKQPHRARSREKKKIPKQGLCSKSESFRKSSNERSRHSSVDSKRNDKMNKFHPRSKLKEKPSPSHEAKTDFPRSRSGCCTRENSLSSRGSSNQSRHSRFSNGGSGDGLPLRSKRTPRSITDNKEDLRFSMSDLETRIHALQKLLSEGLNF